MYIPSHFKIEDQNLIDHFIQSHSFGTLVSLSETYPLASHIPMELEINESGEQVLHGHLSKANAQWKTFETHPRVLAIFQSPYHHYISSSWYHHDNVSTWNYISVQVAGTLRMITGEELVGTLRRITDKYEHGLQNPVSYDTMPDAVKKQIQGIVGFEIKIDKKEAAFKLSQNRNEEDFKNILLELRESGKVEAVRMAELMEELRHKSNGSV